jgi:hypothetical protein
VHLRAVRSARLSARSVDATVDTTVGGSEIETQHCKERWVSVSGLCEEGRIEGERGSVMCACVQCERVLSHVTAAEEAVEKCSQPPPCLLSRPDAIVERHPHLECSALTHSLTAHLAAEIV